MHLGQLPVNHWIVGDDILRKRSAQQPCLGFGEERAVVALCILFSKRAAQGVVDLQGRSTLASGVIENCAVNDEPVVSVVPQHEGVQLLRSHVADCR